MQNTIDQPLITGTGTASAQGISRRVIYFFIVLVISLMLTWLLREPGFTASQLYTLFLLFFSVGLWLTEAIPGFAVALFIMAYLVYTMGNKHLNPSPESIDKYVNTFSSSVIWLLLGGFFLSSAITKTGLDERILRTTLRISGTKPRNILMAFMLATMTASMLMSNTATTAMMVAAILPLLKSLGKTGFSKALLLGISIAASTGGMGTIIGSPSNAVTAGLLEKEGANIDFLGWMIYGLPLAILLTALCYWALVKIFIKSSPPVTFSLKDAQTSGQEDSTARQRVIILTTLVVTVLFWLTESIHGVPVAAVSAIPIVVLTLSGVLNSNDIRSLPWDTLFLVAGSLSLGVALEATGLLDHYAGLLKSAHMSEFAFLLILAYAAMIFSNVMSNSATCVVLIPLGTAVMPGWEKEIAMTAGLASLMSIFLPVSTPPNAIAYGTGFLKQKDFSVGGVIVGLLGPLLVVFYVTALSF